MARFRRPGVAYLQTEPLQRGGTYRSVRFRTEHEAHGTLPRSSSR